jgi:hypothetical protein
MKEMPKTSVGGGFAVLEDPTGRRARWMRRAGRLVFLLFLGWLLVIVLGGLGFTPVAGIPLARALRPSSGPPPLDKETHLRQPSDSDLRPALAAPTGKSVGKTSPARSRGRTAPAPNRGGASPGQTKTTPGQTKTTPGGGTQGKTPTAPGQTTATPGGGGSQGKSPTAPGQTKTTPGGGVTRGQSPSAPGQTKTTSTSPPPARTP